MSKMFEKTKLMRSCLALVMAAALLTGVVAVTGCAEKDPNPTEGTSNVGVTDPTGTTGGNGDNTDPTDPEVPDVPDVTDPTGTPENPTDPSVPPVVDPAPSPGDPAEPDESGDDPDDGPEIVPTVPGDEPYEPLPSDPSYDFTGITPGNLKAEDWKSWDSEQRQAFVDTYDIANLSLDDKYNFYLQTQFNGYDCGFEGHHCAAQEHHDQVMAEMAAGCPHCGGNDCAAFYARNMMGFTQIDYSECLEYDITKDPVYYCQVCGLVKGSDGCNKSISGRPCEYCGEPREPMACHHCEHD